MARINYGNLGASNGMFNDNGSKSSVRAGAAVDEGSVVEESGSVGGSVVVGGANAGGGSVVVGGAAQNAGGVKPTEPGDGGPRGGAAQKAGGNRGGTESWGIKEDGTIIAEGYGDGKKVAKPPVGFLVCVEGPDKFATFTLYMGKTKIGRCDPKERKAIELSDMAVSRSACVIDYDDEENDFLLVASESANSTLRLNGKKVRLGKAEEMGAYDEIMLGDSTKLRFIPLCGEQFRWEKKE